MQRHPKLEETSEIELINSYVPVNALTVTTKHFKSMDTLKSECNTTNAITKNVNILSCQTNGTIFDEHRISICKWTEYGLNIFMNVTVIADSWNNKTLLPGKSGSKSVGNPFYSAVILTLVLIQCDSPAAWEGNPKGLLPSYQPITLKLMSRRFRSIKAVLP